jgi:phosphatidate phosphatase APP1
LPKIIPYIGFGNNDKTFITGEVVEGYDDTKPAAGQPRWKNIKATLKRYLINDLEGVTVTVSFNGLSQEVVTDKYGIFRCSFDHPGRIPSGETWQKATITLASSKYNGKQFPPVEAEVMVVDGNPDFGVISDIDDTILVSYATQKLMKIRLLLFNNAHTRIPFEGVSAFYRALQSGPLKNKLNPIFYLSNSEWNLYDLLHEFIEFNRIPKGPLFLREMKIRPLQLHKIREVNKNHKKEVLVQLFSAFPEMKFILIGDSGQRDPDVYSEIVKQYPGRVLAIYIRDVGVTGNNVMVKTISQRIHDEFAVEMVLVKDTEAAAKHAIEKGFISKDYLDVIHEEVQHDIEMKDQPQEKLI